MPELQLGAGRVKKRLRSPRHVAGLDSVLNTGVLGGGVGEAFDGATEVAGRNVMTVDALYVRAVQHQAELRREAAVSRLVRRELKPGRTFRVVPPPIAWPRTVRTVGPDEEVAA